MAKAGHRDGDASNELTGKCILVAEDDADNQKIVSMILGGKGAITLPVTNAVQLRAVLSDIASARTAMPDAVILDWNLAGTTGDEIIAEIHNQCPSLTGRILIVTGDILARGSDASAGHGDRSRHGPRVLLKPFSPADLTHALSELLKACGQG